MFWSFQRPQHRDWFVWLKTTKIDLKLLKNGHKKVDIDILLTQKVLNIKLWI